MKRVTETIQHRNGVKAELEAAIRFVDIGYEIYWPIHSQSRCDFIVSRYPDVWKIQVKKATWSKTGNHRYLQARLSTRNKNSRPKYTKEDFDYVVFVEESGMMWMASFREIEGMTSVCLTSSNPDYRPQTKYDANEWVFRD